MKGANYRPLKNCLRKVYNAEPDTLNYVQLVDWLVVNFKGMSKQDKQQELAGKPNGDVVKAKLRIALMLLFQYLHGGPSVGTEQKENKPNDGKFCRGGGQFIG